MEESSLLRDLAVVMALGGAVTVVFHRLRQPVVLGYILAGVLGGPEMLAWIRAPNSIHTLAELGVTLLLFSIGIEFNLRRIRRVAGVATLSVLLEIPLVFWLGYSVARVAGWTAMDGVFLGAILSISSTTIIVKTMMDLGHGRAEFARIITGILIAQDVAVVVMLVVLAGVATAGTVAARDVLVALGGVTLFVVTVTIVGLLVIPNMLRALARVPSPDVLTVGVLGLCFGVAIVSSELGFSVALGAFLTGAVLAETREAHEVAARIEPIRDMFSAMFFVAVGLSIDPYAIVDHAGLVLALSLLSVIAKLVTCGFGTMMAGYSPRTAVRVGIGLAPIGEFSFVIANLGRSAGVVSDFVYAVTVGVSAVTTLATPYLLGAADRIADLLTRTTPVRLREFFQYYDGRLAGWRGRRWQFPTEARWSATRFAVSGSLLLTLLFVVRAASLAVRAGLGAPASYSQYANIVVWSAGGILSVPLLIALWRSGGELSTTLSRRLTGRTDGSRVVTEAFRFALTMVAALIFLAVASPLFPTGVPLILTVVLVVLSGTVFWRSLAGVHEDAERALTAILSAAQDDEPAPGAKAELTRLIRGKYAFDVVLEDFILPLTLGPDRPTIRGLALRSTTGATIAAIYREDQVVVNPDPDIALEPGDVLLLLGSKEQVATAIGRLGDLGKGK